MLCSSTFRTSQPYESWHIVTISGVPEDFDPRSRWSSVSRGDTKRHEMITEICCTWYNITVKPSIFARVSSIGGSWEGQDFSLLVTEFCSPYSYNVNAAGTVVGSPAAYGLAWSVAISPVASWRLKFEDSTNPLFLGACSFEQLEHWGLIEPSKASKRMESMDPERLKSERLRSV